MISPVNVLDTFENTFTLDMVKDPAVTVNLFLTQADMAVIHQKMKEIDFFNYPSNFNDRIPPGQPTGNVVPPVVYYFKVKDGAVVKEVTWNAGILYQDKKADDFESLSQLIQKIIASKDEYKRLPKPTSVYL